MTNKAAENVLAVPDDERIPSHIKELSEPLRQTWVDAQKNGLGQDTANTLVKGLLPLEEQEEFAQKCDSYVAGFFFEKIGQDEAEYSTIGETETQACANCRWFISPNNCAIVASWPDPITPNGLSNRWEEKPDPERDPLRVVIVEDEDKSGDVSEGEKQETKREGGVDYPSSDFAVAPDSSKPSTWKLRLAEGRAGNQTVAQVGRAITALQPSGFRGRRVQLSSSERKTALSKIGGAIRRISGATADQKRSLRERLDAVKTCDIIFEIPLALIDKAKSTILSLLRSEQERGDGFVFRKDANGEPRWFAWATNKWRDHDDPPEIIRESAHKDYVKHVDETGQYPEAWLWHTPSTKWGSADRIDYADGFLVVSGTVDPGMEHVAESLSRAKGLGVSHGFKRRHNTDDSSIIDWYRSFEVSPLPIEAAANPWTSIEVIMQEADMVFSDKKREWLAEHLGEEAVAGLEGDTAKARELLEKAGVDWKDAPEDDPAGDGENDQARDGEGDGDGEDDAAVKAGKAAAAAILESDVFKGLVASGEEISTQVKGILARVEKLEKTDDEKIAAAVGARDHRPASNGGHVASRADGSEIKQGDPDYEEAAKGPNILDNIMQDMEVVPGD